MPILLHEEYVKKNMLNKLEWSSPPHQHKYSKSTIISHVLGFSYEEATFSNLKTNRWNGVKGGLTLNLNIG